MPALRNPMSMSDKPTCFLMSFAGIADMKVPFRLESLRERTAQDIESGLIQSIETKQGVFGQLKLQCALQRGSN
jgi:hypothetical protein